MSQSAARPLTPLRWIGVPTLQAVIATLVLLTPIRVFGLHLPEPVFGLVLAFAWAVIRPSMVAPFALLGLGVFMDVAWGSPLGLWSLSLLVAYGAVLSARTILVGQNLPMMWAAFAVTCAIGELAGFLFIQIQAHAMPSLIGAAWQFLATVLLYPLADRLIDQFEDADVRFR